jgi:predicted  nucleic acid-binding Zn-ribbon protein
MLLTDRHAICNDTAMMQVLTNLVQLQGLGLEAEHQPSNADQIDQLRLTIPAAVLLNYDRLRARGKKGVAMVRHGVCGQCHMQVAVGQLALLRRQDNLYRCENCGSYLCLVDEPAPVLEMPPRGTKPVRKGRPRKLPAHAA